jgi:hypothetical protein
MYFLVVGQFCQPALLVIFASQLKTASKGRLVFATTFSQMKLELAFGVLRPVKP